MSWIWSNRFLCQKDKPASEEPVAGPLRLRDFLEPALEKARAERNEKEALAKTMHWCEAKKEIWDKETAEERRRRIWLEFLEKLSEIQPGDVVYLNKDGELRRCVVTQIAFEWYAGTDDPHLLYWLDGGKDSSWIRSDCWGRKWLLTNEQAEEELLRQLDQIRSQKR